MCILVSTCTHTDLVCVNCAGFSCLALHMSAVISIDRFRPNIVVAGRRLAPFAEDTWSRLSIVSSAPRKSDTGPCDPTLAPLTSGFDSSSSTYSSSSPSSALAPCEFAVEGPCTRCVMVNVDQRTGARRSLLFKTLAACRRGQNHHHRAVPRSAASASAAFTSMAADSSQPMAVDTAATTAESNQSPSALVPSGRITFGALLALRPPASTTSAATAAGAMRFLRVGDTVLPSSV
jgi:hypothetical protein